MVVFSLLVIINEIQESAMYIFLIFTKCRSWALSEVIIIKVKVLKVNCFKNNRSTGIVLMLFNLQIKLIFLIVFNHTNLTKKFTSRIYSFHRHFQRCWSNYKSLLDPSKLGNGLGSIFLSKAWVVGSGFSIQYNFF